MISGSFSNGFVVSQAPINSLDQIQAESMLYKGRQMNRSQVGGGIKLISNLKANDQEPKQLLDYAKIKISVVGIQKLTINESLITHSYAQSVQQIPLPNKELEEKILQNNQGKKDHYQFLLGLQSILKKNCNQSRIQPKVGDVGRLEPDNMDEDIGENDNNNQNGGYFFDVSKEQKIQQEKSQKIQIEDFQAYTGCWDLKIAQQYISRFPQDTQKQVQQYIDDQAEKEKEDMNQRNIEKFKQQTNASAAEAIHYLSIQDNLVEAIRAYNEKKEESEMKNKIIEFKNITMCTQQVADQYIAKYKDLIIALEMHQKEEVNKQQNFLAQVIEATGLSSEKAQWYLDASGNDVKAAIKMYNDFK